MEHLIKRACPEEGIRYNQEIRYFTLYSEDVSDGQFSLACLTSQESDTNTKIISVFNFFSILSHFNFNCSL